MMKYLQRSVLILIVAALTFLWSGGMVSAYTAADIKGFLTGTPYNDDEDAEECSLEPAGSGTPNNATGSNLDYAGRPILTDAQLQAIQDNQPIYQQAAEQV